MLQPFFKETYGFFFQAEDGIRDIGVTGVQTCALPILGRTLPIAAVPHFTTTSVNPMANTAVRPNSRTLTDPLATLLTIASTSKPRMSSITAAPRMILLARSCSKSFAASTCAVIPTLVATRAAPTNMDSIRDSPQIDSSPQPAKNGMITPDSATALARGPALIKSDDLTSRPTRNSR